MTVEKGLFPVINRDGTCTMMEGTKITLSPEDIIKQSINEDGSITLEYKNGEQVVVSSEYSHGVSFTYESN